MEIFLVNAPKIPPRKLCEGPLLPPTPRKSKLQVTCIEKRIHRRPIDRWSADLYKSTVKLRVKGLRANL